MAWWHNS